MANKWFDNTFLPSLFNRYGANNPHWITAKQTQVCTDNMQVNTCIENDGFTTMRHKYFTYEWNGRKVTLQYSSKNGCGTIVFSSTITEATEASKQNAIAKQSAEVERLRKQKANHPDHFSKRIAEVEARVNNLKDMIAMDEADGLKVDPLDIETLKKAEKELAFLQSI